ncbi:MAG: phage Gp37/Gp68 family protein [Anaerolineales bacterium]|nr:phage Gp37/Gp68 family protein [Anaerolineales bacterium]NUQ84819.1 DUF5131 family protein [Anaerolineales bacterium]
MQEWVTDIRDQCPRAKVPFFFKQWGGVQKKRAGRILEGRTWDEMPVNMNLVKAKIKSLPLETGFCQLTALRISNSQSGRSSLPKGRL